MPHPDDNDDRDHREVTLYDDEALQLMQGWWSGQGDPLYAIHSMGGRHEAWVFQHAISNLDSDIRRVKPLGRGKYQFGKGTFSKKEIDELHTIRDALATALYEVTGEMQEGTDPRFRRQRRGVREAWAGIDHNDAAFHSVRNALVGIIIDGIGQGQRQVPPEKADEYIERGRRVLADFEGQAPAPGGARGRAQRWMARKTNALQRLLSDAEAVRSGARTRRRAGTRR